MKMLTLWTLTALTVTTPMLGTATEWPASHQLGASHPDTADLSLDPHWHVYKFQRDGVAYLQLNDLNDQPRFAVALANGRSLVLPLGTDTSHVQVEAVADAEKASTMRGPCGCELIAIYKTPDVQIINTPSPEGDTWQIQPIQTAN